MYSSTNNTSSGGNASFSNNNINNDYLSQFIDRQVGNISNMSLSTTEVFEAI